MVHGFNFIILMVSLLLINSNYSEISNKLLGSAEMTINQLRQWCTISKLLPQDVFLLMSKELRLEEYFTRNQIANVSNLLDFI
jgi:hypothetical protein